MLGFVENKSGAVSAEYALILAILSGGVLCAAVGLSIELREGVQRAAVMLAEASGVVSEPSDNETGAAAGKGQGSGGSSAGPSGAAAAAAAGAGGGAAGAKPSTPNCPKHGRCSRR